MRINYYQATTALLQLKPRLKQLASAAKYGSIIEFLNDLSVDWEAEDVDIPDIKAISMAVGMKRQKVHDAVYQLYKELLDHLASFPVDIKRVVHVISIHVPWDEEHKYANKEFWKQEQDRGMYMEVYLAVTPRIGDRIELSFVDRSIRFQYGYVHEVQHIITPMEQQVWVIVHPYRNYYDKWMKLKVQHERDARFAR